MARINFSLWSYFLLKPGISPSYEIFIKYLPFMCLNKKMRGFWRKLRRNALGATVVEYGLIVGLIAVAAIASMQTLGLSLSDFFFYVDEELVKAEGSK